MSRIRSLVVFSCAALVSLGWASSALGAASYTVEKVAISGETAPGTTQIYSAFDVTREGAGKLAFTSMLTDDPPCGPPYVPPCNPPTFGTYRADAGGIGTVAMRGETAPSAGGAVYAAFLSFPNVDASGGISFGALLMNGTPARGIFLDVGGVDTALVVDGDPAPGATSFTPTTSDLQLHGRNASGDFAFRSALATGDVGLFLGTGSGFTTIALEGDAAPTSGTFANLGNPSLGGGGHVVFTSDLTGGTAPSGIYRFHGGAITELVTTGSPAPGTGGGTYDGGFLYPVVNASGSAAFVSMVAGGTSVGGYFVVDGSGAVSPVAVAGDTLPETGGATLTGMSSLPTLSDGGDVAFTAQATGGSVAGGVFLADGGSELRAVALLGEEAPDAGGATYTQFWYVGVDPQDRVAFTADLSDGSSGLFLAGPAGGAVPSLGPGGVLLLLGAAGAILATARRAGARLG